jgi:ectoine hydroxylase-related dioxygenase (phytanoyl-CoA dioxygenase family)
MNGKRCEMTLSEEQIQHFYREGYVVAPGLVPIAMIEAVLSAIPEDAGKGQSWSAKIFDFDRPDEDAALHRLLVAPSVIGAAQDIFGTEARLYYGMLAVVPAHGGNGLPWHQDNQYSQILGGALNVFIALCEITPDKAILWVAPGSHKQGTLPSKANETTARGHREAVVEPESGIPLPTMQPGDVCLFDRNTYHRSLTNETGEPRYAYAAQYSSKNARYADTGQIPPGRMLATELDQRWQEGIL